MNLSIGLVPLLITALELVIVMAFLRFLAMRWPDSPLGKALGFIVG